MDHNSQNRSDPSSEEDDVINGSDDLNDQDQNQGAYSIIADSSLPRSSS